MLLLVIQMNPVRFVRLKPGTPGAMVLAQLHQLDNCRIQGLQVTVPPRPGLQESQTADSLAKTTFQNRSTGVLLKGVNGRSQ